MKSTTQSGTFEDALAHSTPRERKLARALRKIILDVYPNAVEVPWPRQKIVGYGVGPKKLTEHFCYIAPYGAHVNLGFNFGAGLPDPSHLLEGAGKKFRHVKIAEPGDVQRPALRQLLKAAVRERERALNREV